MFGSGREALPDVREWSGGPREFTGVVGRPTRITSSGRRPSRISRSGWKTHQDVQEWSECPPRSPGVDGWLS